MTTGNKSGLPPKADDAEWERQYRVCMLTHAEFRQGADTERMRVCAWLEVEAKRLHERFPEQAQAYRIAASTIRDSRCDYQQGHWAGVVE